MINQPFNVKDTSEIQVVPLLERTQMIQGGALGGVNYQLVKVVTSQLDVSVGDLGACFMEMGSKQWQNLTSSLETMMFLPPYSFRLQFLPMSCGPFIFFMGSLKVVLGVDQQRENRPHK